MLDDTITKQDFSIVWHTPTLLNGWKSYNSIAGATLWHEPGFTVTPDGFLVFRGLVSAASATGAIMFTLPKWATPRMRAEMVTRGFNSVSGFNLVPFTAQENGEVWGSVIANQSWVTLESNRVWMGT